MLLWIYFFFLFYIFKYSSKSLTVFVYTGGPLECVPLRRVSRRDVVRRTKTRLYSTGSVHERWRNSVSRAVGPKDAEF